MLPLYRSPLPIISNTCAPISNKSTFFTHSSQCLRRLQGDSALHDVSISPAPAEIDGEGHVAGTGQPVTYVAGGKLEADDGSSNPHSRVHYEEAAETRPGTWYGRAWKVLKTPGSALQIVIAAVIALAIGMAVNVTVDTVPSAAVVVLGIPGRLWLRSLTAVGMSYLMLSHHPVSWKT